MVMYFFRTLYRDSYSHEHGVDLPDIVTAKIEVCKAASEVVAELIREGARIDDFRFEIRDENGNIVLLLPFHSMLN